MGGWQLNFIYTEQVTSFCPTNFSFSSFFAGRPAGQMMMWPDEPRFYSMPLTTKQDISFLHFHDCCGSKEQREIRTNSPGEEENKNKRNGPFTRRLGKRNMFHDFRSASSRPADSLPLNNDLKFSYYYYCHYHYVCVCVRARSWAEMENEETVDGGQFVFFFLNSTV